jgi:hypothetical protein
MLLLLVSYPLGLVFVPVDNCRHVEYSFLCVGPAVGYVPLRSIEIRDAGYAN